MPVVVVRRTGGLVVGGAGRLVGCERMSALNNDHKGTQMFIACL